MIQDDIKFEIVKEQPPNIDSVRKMFEPGFGTFYCFGEKLYNPDGVPIPEDILHHESVHSVQQREFGIMEWWDRYISDKEFRFEQELEAFGEQYKWVKEKNPEYKQDLDKFFFVISSILHSKQYGTDLTFGQIEAKLRRYIKGPSKY